MGIPWSDIPKWRHMGVEIHSAQSTPIPNFTQILGPRPDRVAIVLSWYVSGAWTFWSPTQVNGNGTHFTSFWYQSPHIMREEEYGPLIQGPWYIGTDSGNWWFTALEIYNLERIK